MYKISFTIILLLTLNLSLAAELSVNIKNITTNKGRIRFTLYPESEATNFPTKKPKLKLINKQTEEKSNGISVVAQKGEINFIVIVPAGIYAATVYHDKDENGKLNRMFLIQKPTEPYGFSNNIRHTVGPASFKEAQFKISEPNTKIFIKIQ